MLKLIFGVILLLINFSAQSADDKYIINSGVDRENGPYGRYGWGFGGNSFAARFTIPNDVYIGSIETNVNVVKAGLFSFGISADNGGDIYLGQIRPSETLMSQSIYLPANKYDDYEWAGVFNLNWKLVAGTYWVTTSADTGYGGISASAMNGLEGQTMRYGNNEWQYMWASWIGVPFRIATPVPELEIWEISIAGLLLIAFQYKRHRNRNQSSEN